MEASLLTFFLNKSYDLLREGRKISKDARKQLESLINLVEQMTVFIENADSMGIENDAHRLRLKQVREVLFDAEDLIQKYMLREGQLRGLRHPSLKKMQVPFKRLLNKKSIYDNAEDLKSRAADAVKSLQGFNDDFGQGSSFQAQNETDIRMATFLLTADQLVGIKRPQGMLVQNLLEDKIFMVSAIHGMAGIGKTTLANAVFCDGGVKRRFPCRVWAKVSERYHNIELLKKIVRKLCTQLKESTGNIDQMDDLALTRKIRRLLQRRPYVLVLDDVWREDLLHSIKDTFKGTHGRLIITTRDQTIAEAFSMTLPGRPHKMDLFSQADSLKLFCQITFGQDACPPGFVDVSEEVLKKCGRLPLAIRVVSSLFVGKCLTEWEKQLNRLGNLLADNQSEIGKMKRAFSVSIDMLPSDLKSCLLYLSIFPPDLPIQCSQLIRLWISEGFVKASEGTALEKANESLEKLKYKNLIEVAETTSDGRMKTCRIHTILHEIIVDKAWDVELALTTSGGDNSRSRIFRYLSIYGMVQDTIRGMVQDEGRSKRIRSLFIFKQLQPRSQEYSIHSLLSKHFKMLNVLDLQDPYLGKISKKIFKYKYLKYLSLRGTKVREIPESISEFRYLETLDLKHTHVSKLPPSIGKLKLLRYLLVYHYEMESYYPVFHFKCGFKAPPSIGALKLLQKLCIIDMIRVKQSLLNNLGKLKELRRLGITNLRNQDGPALDRSIEKLEKLNALSITSASEEEFLQLSFSSVHLPMSLQRLYLTGCLQELPERIGHLHNLVKLSLKGSQLSYDPLGSLKNLEKLEHLELQKFYIGETLKFGYGGFRKLRLLGLDDFPQLTGVEVEGEGQALQVLEKLTIERCRQLRKLPKGIEKMTKLRVLELFSLDKDLIRAAKKDGHEYWKIEHIPEVYTSEITEDQTVEYFNMHTGAIVTNLQMPRSLK